MAEAEQAVISESVSQSVPRPPGEARSLLEIGRSQLEDLRTHHRGVLETDDVEAVHKMRVMTRRLQASLDLLEHELGTKKLKRQLRRWRRKLSEVRNYDVFLQLIDSEANNGRKAHREPFALVKAILQERRVRRATRVRKFLEAIDLEVIALRLGSSTLPSAIADAQLNESGSDGAVQSALEEPRVLLFDERRVAAYAADRLDQRLAEFQAMVAQSHPTTHPEELHQLRIAAKRVRYLLEIVTEMGYGEAVRSLAW